MIATVEIRRIAKTGRIDNCQVCCIADALVGLAGEELARRFVNKRLEESALSGVQAFPPSFPMEKFVQANRIWTREDWMPKHRLLGGADSSATEVQAKPAPGGSASTARDQENRVRDELSAALDTARERLRQAVDARVRAEADAAEARVARAKLAADLDEAQARLSEAVSTATRLEAEKVEIEARLATLQSVFPDDVSALGAKLARDMPDTVGARRVIYLYLAMITADPIEEPIFGNRFKLFDDELYSLFKDDPSTLKRTRVLFAVDVNARLAKHRVSWDLLGETFDAEKFSTSDSFGTKVTDVISALITADDGSVVRRAKVRTCRYGR